MSTVSTPLWVPTPERVRDSNFDQFRRAVEHATGQHIPDSRALQTWSIDNLDVFWGAVWDRAVTCGHRGNGDVTVPITDPPGVRFFPDAHLSYAEELLHPPSGSSPTAVIAWREDGHRETWTWTELQQATATVATLFRDAGVGPGDVVAAWAPNYPSTLISMLAANSLGAIFTSASQDFGVAGVVDRFAQVEPKVLVCSDGYVYGGKQHVRLDLLADICAQLPTVRAVFVDQQWDTELPTHSRVHPWPNRQTLIAGDVESSLPSFVHRSYADPGFILYSSGTTGTPKCIVHSAMGLLVKHWTEHSLHCDIRPGDVVFYYTTCGWMMWNWLVGALAQGATIVLYDGSPFGQTPEVLWDIAESEGVTLFGTSAKYLDACRKKGLQPQQTHDLSTLRTVTSTGSPLSPDDFSYVYRDIKDDVHLASISGGTDICGCFVIGDPTQPVYAGEIQGPALGAGVDVWSEAGASLQHKPGQMGELVCTTPLPSMPLGFVGDPHHDRYRASYFERFPGVWAHGDFASWTNHQGVVIHGRSDATLNAGGVRIGTAEIYRQVDHFPEVVDAVAVGYQVDNDSRIVLFVHTEAVEDFSTELTQAIRDRLKTHASPRHVPWRILYAPDIPRTRSGKIAELAVADAINGRAIRNTHALANPNSLEFFHQVNLPEL